MKLARALASLAVVAVVACGGGDDVIESEKIDSPTTEIGTEPPEVETDLPEIPDTDDGDDTEGGDSDTDDTEGGDSDSDTDDSDTEA